jgi:hypothetical protein
MKSFFFHPIFHQPILFRIPTYLTLINIKLSDKFPPFVRTDDIHQGILIDISEILISLRSGDTAWITGSVSKDGKLSPVIPTMGEGFLGGFLILIETGETNGESWGLKLLGSINQLYYL